MENSIVHIAFLVFSIILGIAKVIIMILAISHAKEQPNEHRLDFTGNPSEGRKNWPDSFAGSSWDRPRNYRAEWSRMKLDYNHPLHF